MLQQQFDLITRINGILVLQFFLWPVEIIYLAFNWDFDIGQEEACTELDHFTPLGIMLLDHMILAQASLICSKCTILRFKEAALLNQFTLLEWLFESVLLPKIDLMENGINIYEATPGYGIEQGRKGRVFVQDRESLRTTSKGLKYSSNYQVTHEATCTQDHFSTTSVSADASAFTEASLQYFEGYNTETTEVSPLGKITSPGLLYGENELNLSKLITFNVPVGAFLGSKLFADLYQQFASSMKGKSQSRAEAICSAYKASVDVDNFPCLRKDVLRRMSDATARNDFSKETLGSFMDEFGTHVVSESLFGGMFVNMATWDTSAGSNGETKAVSYVQNKGWVSMTKGKGESDFKVDVKVTGFTRGSPTWGAGFSPATRLEGWLVKASLDKDIGKFTVTQSMEDPEMIGSMKLIDISPAITLALSQQQKTIDEGQLKFLKELDTFYRSGQYACYLADYKGPATQLCKNTNEVETKVNAMFAEDYLQIFTPPYSALQKTINETWKSLEPLTVELIQSKSGKFKYRGEIEALDNTLGVNFKKKGNISIYIQGTADKKRNAESTKQWDGFIRESRINHSEGSAVFKEGLYSKESKKWRGYVREISSIFPGVWQESIYDNEGQRDSGNMTWGGLLPNEVWDPEQKKWVQVKQ